MANGWALRRRKYGSDPRSRLFWQVISGSRTPAPCMNPRRATHLGEQKLMHSVERDRVEHLQRERRHLDPLRLKRKGKGCRLDRPPQPGTEPASSFSHVLAKGTPPSGPCWHGAVTGPLTDSRPPGKPLGITRCGQRVPMFQVREVICQRPICARQVCFQLA